MKSIAACAFLVSAFLSVCCLGCGAEERPATSDRVSPVGAPLLIPLNTKPNGTSCSFGGECISSNCTDGVCCDSACQGTCVHCALPGLLGNCSYVPAGEDPRGDCPGESPCGARCDGAGGCVYASASTRCAPCARCDGTGDCGLFEAADSDPGDACGLCRVCPGDGPDCIFVPAGRDPLDECAQQSPASCGLTGWCNGQGKCALYPADTLCAPESCQDGVHHPADWCDGAGLCVDSGQDLCRPYVCQNVTVCREDCQEDGHCSAGSRCQGGECLAYLNLGEPCSRDAACISGHCVDGVCCQSACDAECHTCNRPQNPGTCLAAEDGQDPRDDCPGTGLCAGVCNGQGACRFTADNVRCDTCTSCDGAGSCSRYAAAGSDPFDDCSLCWACSGEDSSCRLVPAGSDPSDDCPASPPEGCGMTGFCNGSGSCMLWPQGTVCAPAYCAGGLLVRAYRCDGQGRCIGEGQVDCNGYACLGDDACRTDCAADDHCLAGYHCADSACVGNLAEGLPCARDAQCLLGHCADGFCCRSACAGLCERCDLAGREGTCSPVPAGQDPDGDCRGEGPCGGSCDGAGSCQFPWEDTACAPCAYCDRTGNCAAWVPAGDDPGGVCGLCRVCPGDGPDCILVADGEDPHDECQQQQPDSCGQDGWCDGRGGCRLWSAGTRCGEQSCSGDTLRRAPGCDGAGLCADRGTVSCAALGCDGDNCAGPQGLHHLTLENSPGGSGQPVGNRKLTTDDNLTLFAVGRDASGGFLGDIPASWRVEGGIGAIDPGPARSADFDPRRIGSGRVVASFHDPQVAAAATGTLEVGPGVAAGAFALKASPGLIPPDGVSFSSISAGPVMDADGNPVADSTSLIVKTTAGTLQGEGPTPAAEIQLRTRSGMCSFKAISTGHPARAAIQARAEPPGRARGETTIYFSYDRPVADAGPDRIAHCGQRVILDGSGSWDSRQRPLEYRWTQLEGQAVALDLAQTATPAFWAPAAATGREVLVFGLSVRAGDYQSGVSTVSVTLLGAQPGLPRPLAILDPPEGPAPLAVLLDGSGSQAAAEAVLTGYLWAFSDEAPVVEGETASRLFETPGGHGVQLLVIDDRGRFNYSGAQVSVLDGNNRPPLLAVTAVPPRGEAPLKVAFRAQAADPDGRVERIEWDFGAGFLPGGEEQTVLFSGPGLHPVRVRATDDQQLSSLQELLVAVSRDGFYPPRIVSPPPASARAGEVFTYQPAALGSPPFAWSLGKRVGDLLIRAPAGMVIDGISGKITWSPAAGRQGAAEVTLVASNSTGNGMQDFTILVVPAEPAAEGCSCAGHPPRGSILFLLCLLGLRASQRRRARSGYQ